MAPLACILLIRLRQSLFFVFFGILSLCYPLMGSFELRERNKRLVRVDLIHSHLQTKLEKFDML
jgi:hypothetical protein